MRKRGRENPCGVCGHYHKYEEGEVCGICGHLPVMADTPSGSLNFSAFPSEILPEFLYLGSYDNASRSEILKSQGITCVLNTVPACQNLHKHTFLYHRLQDNNTLQFEDAIQFIEQCEREKSRVLVHCMSGKSRSAACVVAYLMKSKGWRLQQSYNWVKEKRPIVEITQGLLQQLQDFEQKLFASPASQNSACPQFFTNPAAPSFSFGLPSSNDQPCVSFSSTNGTASVLSPSELDGFSQLTFVSGQTPMNNKSAENNGNNNNVPMDRS